MYFFHYRLIIFCFRLWLCGYSEEKKPLTREQMYDDISQEHANKTVTFEQHSSLPSLQCSVHPCKYVQYLVLEIIYYYCNRRYKKPF